MIYSTKYDTINSQWGNVAQRQGKEAALLCVLERAAAHPQQSSLTAFMHTITECQQVNERNEVVDNLAKNTPFHLRGYDAKVPEGTPD